jgi:hypothetical protein
MLKFITENEYLKLLDAESIPDNFNKLAIEASYIINKRYVVDINNISDEVKYVTCKIVELLNDNNIKKSEIGTLKSTNIEGWSETYKTDVEIDNELNKSIQNVLDLYLTTTLKRTKGVILYE